MPTFPIAGDGECALYGSYSRNAPTRAVVRTQMEIGAPKTRRRSTLAMYQITAAYAVNNSALTDFNNWYRSDISMGALSFDWTDPRNGTVRVVKFAEDGYAISQLSPARWRIDVRLEEWV